MEMKIASKITHLDANKLSREAFVLNETFLKRLQQSRQQLLEACIRVSTKEIVQRSFYLVRINGAAYWADSNTGSLYDNQGNCKSSSLLRLLAQPAQISRNAKPQVRIAA